jgi:uncharacterized protein (DUF4415 family)
MKKEHGHSVIAKDAKGQTDWDALRARSDAEVLFTEDAPATSPDDWINAIAHQGLPVHAGKTQIALRVDDDVLAWFKAQGAEYQTRMNAVLRAFRNAHLHNAENQGSAPANPNIHTSS